jgi:two-component system, NarL family, sensor histidine kinase UhpB
VSGLTVGEMPGGELDLVRPAATETPHLRHRELETVRRRLVRLAFDIHDGPLQSLAAAGFGLKDLHGRVAALLVDTPERDAAGELIVDLIDELSETERALRKLVDTLEDSHPEIADANELLDAELKRFRRRCTANVVVDGEWQFHPDSHSQALALEALLREALTNIAKHSGASNVTIRLQTSSTHVLLEIEDDGCGFDPMELDEATMGLTSMRERVKLIGGEFEILSRPGGPTLATATLRRWRRALSTASAYTAPPIAAKIGTGL